MTPTQAAAYQLLLAEVGDTPDTRLAGMGAALFTVEAGWLLLPLVQYQAVKIRMLDILIAYWRDLIARTMNEDERKTFELRLHSLEAQRTSAVLAQTTAQQNTNAVGAVVAGRLTTTAPISSPTGLPDANDSQYRGDPNVRTWGRGW